MNFARLWGRRGYRFEGERENHAEQAATTEISLGLMAAAAQHSDDEHRIQTMQTEHTLRERQRVLEANQAERGLTSEERGELESIRRGLAELHPPTATLEAVGQRRLAEFGAVGQPRRFLGAIAAGPWALLLTPWTLVVAGLAAFMAQGAWLKHVSHERDELRHELRQTEDTLHARTVERDLAVHAAADADARNAASSHNWQEERARRERAEREARRIRDAMAAASRGESVDYGFGRVRDPGPPDGQAGASGGDPAGGHPG